MLTTKQSQNITGYITKIEAALMSDLNSIYYFPVNNSMTIAFKEGKAFSEEYFSKGSARLNPKTDPTNQGNLYGFELSWQNAGLEASETINLSESSEELIILRITDNNNSRIILPYCRISFSQNIGQQHGNFTGLAIVANTLLPHPAPMDLSLGVAVTPVS